MKWQKWMSIGMIFVLATSALVGCGNKEAELSEVNITYVKSPLNVPSIVQRNDGLLDQAFEGDITFKWHEIMAGPDQTNALAAGELDILQGLGGTSAILAAANGVELTITNIYSRAPKGFMLVTGNDDISGIADLRGMKVGGPKGTVLHQLLDTALATEGMTEKDVVFLSMGIPEAQAALANGSIDAAMVAGPNALQALNNGARIVTTGEGLVDGTIVTAVRNDFLQEHPETVAKFLEAHRETLTYIDEHFDEVMVEVAKEVGLTVDEVKEMVTWYDFSPGITEADMEELEKTQRFLLDNGLQEKAIDLEGIIRK